MPCCLRGKGDIVSIKFILSYEQSQRVYGDLFSIIFVGIFVLFAHATSVHFLSSD